MDPNGNRQSSGAQDGQRRGQGSRPPPSNHHEEAEDSWDFRQAFSGTPASGWHGSPPARRGQVGHSIGVSYAESMDVALSGGGSIDPRRAAEVRREAAQRREASQAHIPIGPSVRNNSQGAVNTIEQAFGMSQPSSAAGHVPQYPPDISLSDSSSDKTDDGSRKPRKNTGRTKSKSSDKRSKDGKGPRPDKEGRAGSSKTNKSR